MKTKKASILTKLVVLALLIGVASALLNLRGQIQQASSWATCWRIFWGCCGAWPHYRLWPQDVYAKKSEKEQKNLPLSAQVV